MKRILKQWPVLVILAFSISAGLASSSEDKDKSKVVAAVEGKTITLAELEEAAAAQLEALRIERLRFESSQEKKKHQIMETTLAEMIAESLLEKEAEARGIEKPDLVKQEITSQVEPVTDADAEAFYEENKSRIRGAKERVMPQVKIYLENQRKEEARTSFIDELAEKYSVDSKLEPLRVEVDSEGYPAWGPSDAPVTIVEFSDFQCPYCATLTETLKQIKKDYEGQIRLVFRQFPLRSLHPHAQISAEASLCAADQGKFWEFHDLLFADQAGLSKEALQEKANSLGLNMEEFNACLNSNKYADEVQADLNAGQEVGVTGTPAIFINGIPMSGAVSYEKISEAIDRELQKTE